VAADGNLRSIFRERLRVGFDWTSIETGSTILGVPDSNYCVRVERLVQAQYISEENPRDIVLGSHGVEGWVEFKQTSGWACTLRPEQVGWHLRRHAHGGRTFVATRRWHDGHSRSDAVDELWLHDGCWVRELKTDGLRGAQPLGHWHGGPGQWDWDMVRRILCQ
jgi:hypothetical protein